MTGALEQDRNDDVELSQHRDPVAAVNVGHGALDHLDGIDPHVYERRWKILAVLCTSLVIVIVGNTVLNVALPTITMTSDVQSTARIFHRRS